MIQELEVNDEGWEGRSCWVVVVTVAGLNRFVWYSVLRAVSVLLTVEFKGKGLQSMCAKQRWTTVGSKRYDGEEASQEPGNLNQVGIGRLRSAWGAGVWWRAVIRWLSPRRAVGEPMVLVDQSVAGESALQERGCGCRCNGKDESDPTAL